MTLHDPAVSTLSAPTMRYGLAVFAVTLFASALLLFAVQPMFTKMVLPILGGSPSVWSVAMVFFQACLLIGYAYAHVLTRMLPVGRAAIVRNRQVKPDEATADAVAEKWAEITSLEGAEVWWSVGQRLDDYKKGG